jgi:hypothetical protein
MLDVMSNVILNAEHVMLELCVVMCFVAMMGGMLPPCKACDDEVRELTTLILNQTWRPIVMRSDHEDDCTVRTMWLALARFAIGATPDAWLALRHVVITTWSGCVDEATFLEAKLLNR